MHGDLRILRRLYQTQAEERECTTILQRPRHQRDNTPPAISRRRFGNYSACTARKPSSSRVASRYVSRCSDNVRSQTAGGVDRRQVPAKRIAPPPTQEGTGKLASRAHSEFRSNVAAYRVATRIRPCTRRTALTPSGSHVRGHAAAPIRIGRPASIDQQVWKPDRGNRSAPN
jgi:hypothetical protein